MTGEGSKCWQYISRKGKAPSCSPPFSLKQNIFSYTSGKKNRQYTANMFQCDNLKTARTQSCVFKTHLLTDFFHVMFLVAYGDFFQNASISVTWGRYDVFAVLMFACIYVSWRLLFPTTHFCNVKNKYKNPILFI